MLRFRYLVIFILFILLTGCAARRPQFVDPTGRLLPNPHYMMQTIGYPIAVVFYYAAYEEVEDVDGSKVKSPEYLSLFEHHNIDAKKIKAITLTMEIQNPREIEYSLYQEIIIKGKEVKTILEGGRANTSNMSYRQYVFNLPYGTDVLDVDHHLSLLVEGNEMLRIGHFQYHLIH